MAKKMVNIRLDEDLWKQARLEALKQESTMQEWLTLAIEFKLLSDGVVPAMAPSEVVA